MLIVMRADLPRNSSELAELIATAESYPGITTQVHVMVPRQLATRAPILDVVSAMDEQPRSRAVTLKVVADSDPFAGVEV